MQAIEIHEVGGSEKLLIVDVAYDSVGQSTFEGSLGSIRPRGLLCLFGQASGPVPPFDLNRLNPAGLALRDPSVARVFRSRTRRARDAYGRVLWRAREWGAGTADRGALFARRRWAGASGS